MADINTQTQTTKISLTKLHDPTKKHKPITFKFFYESVVASSFSNMLGILIGHPLDTIKVRMQMSNQHTNFMRVISETVRHEGVSQSQGLFYNYRIFTINELSKRELDTFNVSEATKSFFTGCFSGALGMIFQVPVEVLKCKAQVMKDQHLPMRQLMLQTIKNDGFVSLYRGFAANCIRDIPGWGLYFYTYELLKSWSWRFSNYYLKPSHHPKSREWTINVNAGGLAGVISWLLLYPFDIVKTHIQLSVEKETPKIREVFRNQYKEHGYHYFFRGLKPTLIRAYPVNAITLSSFDYIAKIIQKD
eukprot:403362588